MAKDGILRLNILIFITEVKYLGQKKLTMLQDMFMSKKTLYFEQIPGPTEVNDINNASKNKRWTNSWWRSKENNFTNASLNTFLLWIE